MPVAGEIENMSELVCPHCAQPSTLFGAGGGEQLAAEIGCEVIEKIPVDVALREAGDRGVPVVVACPESASALTSARSRSGCDAPVDHWWADLLI